MEVSEWIAAGNLLAAVTSIVVNLVKRSPVTPAHDAWRGHVAERDRLERVLAALEELRDAADRLVDDPGVSSQAAEAVLAVHERVRHEAETTSDAGIRRTVLDAAQRIAGADELFAKLEPGRSENLEAHEKIASAFESAKQPIERRLRELDRLITAGR